MLFSLLLFRLQLLFLPLVLLRLGPAILSSFLRHPTPLPLPLFYILVHLVLLLLLHLLVDVMVHLLVGLLVGLLVDLSRTGLATLFILLCYRRQCMSC